MKIIYFCKSKSYDVDIAEAIRYSINAFKETLLALFVSFYPHCLLDVKQG